MKYDGEVNENTHSHINICSKLTQLISIIMSKGRIHKELREISNFDQIRR